MLYIKDIVCKLHALLCLYIQYRMGLSVFKTIHSSYDIVTHKLNPGDLTLIHDTSHKIRQNLLG